MSNEELPEWKKWTEKHDLVDSWFTDVKDSSARQYFYPFKKFLDFFGITPKELLEEAKKKPINVKTKINKWYKHNKAEGKAPKTASLYESAVKSFLKFHEVKIKIKNRKTPRKYHREALRRDDIKNLVRVASHLRDKTSIIIAFQTGMAISDLLALNYGDIDAVITPNEKERPKHHFIRYNREKSESESEATIGIDSIKLLNQYIEWRKRRGDKLTKNSPLFTSVREFQAQKRLTKRSAQFMIRETIVKAGLTDFEELKETGTFNPYGFHSIRTAFSTIAKQNGMPPDQVDMSMGHVLDYDGAYWNLTETEKIQNYEKVEPYISIYTEERELIEKTKQTEQDIKQIKEERNLYKQRLEKVESELEYLKVLLVETLNKK